MEEKIYDRWVPAQPKSGPRKMYDQYQTQQKRMDMAYMSSKKYTYSHLSKDGAKWEDRANIHLYVSHGNNELTLKQWSSTFNDFQNWHNLNKLVSLCAYLETYIESIIKMAIESDPGLLVGCPHAIDGIYMLKHTTSIKTRLFNDRITNCVKGDWSKRHDSYLELFGSAPLEYSSHIRELNQMRIMRNNVAHAFGRDIEESRNYSLTVISPMQRLSMERYMKFQAIVKHMIHAIDSQIMNNHIGNFQQLLFYHNMQDCVNNRMTIGDKAEMFKNALGKNNKEVYPKKFSRWLVQYYDSL